MINKNQTAIILLICLSCFCNSITYAKSIISNVPLTAIRTEAFKLQSEVLGLTLDIKITVPLLYDAENKDKEYPTVYVTDGNLTGSFLSSSNNIQSLSYINPAPLPEVITVTIDFITTDYQQVNSNFIELMKFRANYFTPTQVTHSNLGVVGGKADQFIDFIQTELKPFLHSNYNVNKNNQTIIGHSDAGLFVLYVLFTAPDSFDSYIAVSPSISWDNGILFTFEKAYFESRGEMNKQLYMALGIRGIVQ